MVSVQVMETIKVYYAELRIEENVYDGESGMWYAPKTPEKRYTYKGKVEISKDLYSVVKYKGTHKSGKCVYTNATCEEYQNDIGSELLNKELQNPTQSGLEKLKKSFNEQYETAVDMYNSNVTRIQNDSRFTQEYKKELIETEMENLNGLENLRNIIKDIDQKLNDKKVARQIRVQNKRNKMIEKEFDLMMSKFVNYKKTTVKKYLKDFMEKYTLNESDITKLKENYQQKLTNLFSVI